jgi:hypothetical protein
LLLEIRTSVLKYVRFHNLNQLENDKLFELIDMIEYSLPSTVPKTDFSLHPPLLSAHHDSPSIPMAKANELTLSSSNILPVHHDQSAQTKSNLTKLENQDILSKSSSVLW